MTMLMYKVGDKEFLLYAEAAKLALKTNKKVVPVYKVIGYKDVEDYIKRR